MPRFWMRNRHDPVDRLLRESRPQPRDEYVATMLARLESERRRLFRPRSLGRRVLLAAVVTALAFGAAVAAGGVQSASSGIKGLVDVAKKSVNAPAPTTVSPTSGKDNGNKGNSGSKGGGGNGNAQASGPSTTGGSSTTVSSNKPTTASDNKPTTASNDKPSTSTTTTTANTVSGVDTSSSASTSDRPTNQTPADDQYIVAVCHHTGHGTAFVIYVSPQGAANLVAHHPPDYIIDEQVPRHPHPQGGAQVPCTVAPSS
jgi:hypothetical protein